jgi:hypothetical protein
MDPLALIMKGDLCHRLLLKVSVSGVVTAGTAEVTFVQGGTALS